MKIDKILDLNEKTERFKTTISQTRKVADKLEKSQIFEESVYRIRKIVGIPINGFDDNDHSNVLINFISNERKLDYITYLCERLTEKVNLPYTWLESITYFTIFGVFLVPKRHIMYSYTASYRDPFPIRGLNLIIMEKLSKNEFHEVIDLLWKDIERDMRYLDRTTMHKMIRADWGKRVTELRDTNPKTPFKKVADELEKELYARGINVDISEDYAKMLYKRWKKIV